MSDLLPTEVYAMRKIAQRLSRLEDVAEAARLYMAEVAVMDAELSADIGAVVDRSEREMALREALRRCEGT